MVCRIHGLHPEEAVQGGGGHRRAQRSCAQIRRHQQRAHGDLLH